MSKVKIFTDGGHRQVKGKGSTYYSGYGCHVIYENNTTKSIASPLPLGSTNNIAELMAINEAFGIIIEEKIKDAVIASDSMYAILGITSHMYGWIKRGWLKSDGSPPENLAIWKGLYDLVQQAKPYSFTLRHVKAHTGKLDEFSKGNSVADDLATEGLMLSANGQSRVITRNNDTTMATNQVPVIKAKATKSSPAGVKPLSGLADGKRLFIAADSSYETPSLSAYHMCTFEDKKKPTKGKKRKPRNKAEAIELGFLNSKYLGRANAGDYYGIYYTPNPIDVFEVVSARQCAEISGGDNIPACIFADRITSSTARIKIRDGYDPLDEEKSKYLWADKRHIYMDDETQITHLMVPALMCRFAEGYFSNLSAIIASHDSNNLEQAKARLIPVTDHFYDTVPNGVVGLKKVSGGTMRSLNIPANIAGKDVEVTITLGVDCPTAMGLSRLPKQYKSVTVDMVIIEENARTFKLMLLFKADDDKLICYSPCSSLRVLP